MEDGALPALTAPTTDAGQAWIPEFCLLEETPTFRDRGQSQLTPAPRISPPLLCFTKGTHRIPEQGLKLTRTPRATGTEAQGRAPTSHGARAAQVPTLGPALPGITSTGH